jgi:hypothetical protein
VSVRHAGVTSVKLLDRGVEGDDVPPAMTPEELEKLLGEAYAEDDI